LACTTSSARTPPSASAARGSSTLRTAYGEPSASIVWDASRRGGVHDLCRTANGGAATAFTRPGPCDIRAATARRARCKWERGHMAHGAVWLRVRTLSVLALLRRGRACCWGLADRWNWLTGCFGCFLLCRLEDWDTYISGLAHSHSHQHPQSHHSHSYPHPQSHPAHSTHPPASTGAGRSGQGSVH